MIWIFNLKRASASLCDNYHDVFQYITELEHKKVMLDHNHQAIIPNVSNPKSLNDKKSWCVDFCNGNNYTLIETPSQPIESTPPQWQTAYTPDYPKGKLGQAS